MATPITVALVRGLGEAYNNNFLWNNLRPKLNPERFRVVEVRYSPSFGPFGGRAPATDQALWAGVDEAVAEIDRLVAAAPGPVILVGYSFGTLCTNEWIKRNPNNRKVILAPSLANARRKPGRSFGLAIPAQLGGGIFGEYVEDPRLWPDVAWTNDVVANLPLESLIRKGAHLIKWLSIPGIARWGADMAQQLPAIIFQATLGGAAPTVIIDTARSVPMVDGYSRLGQHTSVYHQKHWTNWKGEQVTAFDLLARVINGVKA